MPEVEKKNFFKKSLRVKFLIFFITIVSIVLMFPKGESIESDVTVGSIWVKNDLIASTSFPIYKNPEQYKQEKIKAAESVFPIFIKKDNMLQNSIDSLHSYNKYLTAVIDKDLLDNEPESNLTFLSPSSYNAFRNLRKLENSLSSPNNKNLRQVFSTAEEILKKVYRIDILDLLYNEINKDSIAVREGKFDNIQNKRRYQDLRVVHDFVAEYASNLSENSQLNNAIIEYVNHFIRPSLVYSEDLTEQEIKHAGKVSLTLES